MAYIIADSGSTKCEWCIVFDKKKKKAIQTAGINPYFLSSNQIVEILNEPLKAAKQDKISAVYFYGAGLGNTKNVATIKAALVKVFGKIKIEINTDLIAAARSLLQHNKGIACILGTGSNCGFYNGKKIVKTSGAIGYVLGDEGSGAYLGKKVLQYFLYNTFDDELQSLFTQKYRITKDDILNAVYKQPQPNKYLASFSTFLSENRGHYMIENIIEDGLHDFIFNHIYKFKESWTSPICFTGSVAFAFKDVLKEISNSYELELGEITKQPMNGLIKYHNTL